MSTITDVHDISIEEPSLLDKAAALARNPGEMQWPGRAGWAVGGTQEFKDALRARNARQEALVRLELLNWLAK